MAKIRFEIGNFVRKNKFDMHGFRTGDLFCIVCIYRLRESPNIWRYVLESRKDMNNPRTPMSQAIEMMTLGRSGDWSNRIRHEPLQRGLDAWDSMWYAYGDHFHVTTQDLLNGFKIVSSGDILTGDIENVD